ncbi:MAG: transporter substrate-binding domain-containing protein [Thermodesulfobacteriota bacterium]
MAKKLIILGVIFWAASLGLCGCGDKGAAPDAEAQLDLRAKLATESTVEQVVKRGMLRVGFSTFEPWAMQDKTGKYVGFEIDVATRLAKDMGVDVEFVPTQWSGIIPALLTGKFDVIIGGMSIRPDRNLKVNFTVPYDYSGMSLCASKELCAGFTGLADFDNAQVVLAARLGTTAATAAKKYFPNAQVRLFDQEAQVIQEVLNKNAHAFVASAPLPAFTALAHPEQLFLPLAGTFTKEPIGFAVQKSDVDTLNYFNNWITTVSAEGWLAERKHYWFETREWESLLQ